MPKAYSYVRFSTPDQELGDSKRRQTALAAEYAARHGLELDDKLTFQDLGVSGYRGKNVTVGRLGEFLEAARAGIVEQGSYLLVESLDRMSRQTARKAFRTLEDICEAGVIVVTLSDHRQYSSESLDQDPTSLLMSILIFMRANEESEMKARRLRAVWKNNRAEAHAGERKLTALCPAWLRMKPDRKSFEVIKERAKIVQRIYVMTLKGIGQHAIAKTLNDEGVKPFRSGQMWHRSYIAKILASDTVIGTMTPHIVEHKDGRKVRKPQDPIPGYYPAIIAKERFQRVQALRQGSSNPQRGRHATAPLRNILGGLARCPSCGSTMTVVNKGKKGTRAFVCTKAKAGAGCAYQSVHYDEVEAFFVREADEIMSECPVLDGHGHDIGQQLEQLQHVLSDSKEALAELLSKLEKDRGPRPAAVLNRIRDRETEIEQLEAEEQRLAKHAAVTAPSFVRRRLEQLDELLAGESLDRQAVNVALRQLLSRVEIDASRGELRLHWQHGGESSHVFRWFPKESKAGTRRVAAAPR